MRAALLVLAAGAALAWPAQIEAQAGTATGRADGRWEQRDSRSGGVTARGTARGRSDGRYERRNDRRDRDDRWDRRRDRDWRDRDRWDRRDDRRGHGPAFCRDGRGHPVHGRSWCRDRGWDDRYRWDPRDRRDRGGDRWDRMSWEDVIFDRPNYRQSTIGESLVRALLGDAVFNRIDAHRERNGFARGGYTGSWRQQGSGHVLFVNNGGVPIAQLIDANGDGHAESVLLRGQ